LLERNGWYDLEQATAVEKQSEAGHALLAAKSLLSVIPFSASPNQFNGSLSLIASMPYSTRNRWEYCLGGHGKDGREKAGSEKAGSEKAAAG
jgi:hypothetical protein